MTSIWNKFILMGRKERTKKLNKIASFLVCEGITANQVTYLSLIFGISAVYFLFESFWLFFFFALLHFLMDGLDGTVARIAGPTVFGTYFDYLTDRTITLLLLLKVWIYLDQWHVLIAIGLFLMVQTVHLATKFEYPVLFTRSLLLLVLFLGLPTIAYLIEGVVSLYSLIIQGIYFVKKRKWV